MSNSIKDLLHISIFYNYQDYKKPEDWELKLLMTVNEFIDGLKVKAFTDYDGCGYVVYRNRILNNSPIYLMGSDYEKAHINFNGYNVRLTLLRLVFGNDVKIIWYNR